MKKKIQIMFVVLLIANVLGCAKYGDYLYEERGCINCTLPEAIHDGKALLYVERSPYWLNEFEKHNIYVVQGDKRILIGKNMDRSYCAGYLDPGSATIMVKWTHGEKIADQLELKVESGKIYYIEQKVSGKIFSALLHSKLELVSQEKGEAILRTVIRKCES